METLGRQGEPAAQQHTQLGSTAKPWTVSFPCLWQPYQFLAWDNILRLCRVSANVRQAYEEPALLFLKRWIREAVGSWVTAVSTCIPPPWRTTCGSCGIGRVRPGVVGLTQGGIWWCGLETRRDRIFVPRGQQMARQERAAVLERSPLVPFMDLVLAWGLDVYVARHYCRVRWGHVYMETYELTGGARRLPLFAELRKHRLLAPPPPQTPNCVVSDDEGAEESEGDGSVEAL